jgi:thiol:disulfide interchange protein
MKSSIVVLYADWCSWSKKLFNESFLDPGIRLLRDRLVWIKVNSDKKVEYKQKYQQSGFPMILLFQGDGEVFRKIDGYVDAKALREAIEALVVKKSSQES